MTRLENSALGSTWTSKSNLREIDEEIRQMNRARETQQANTAEDIPTSECSNKTGLEDNHAQSVAEQDEFIPIKGYLKRQKQR